MATLAMPEAMQVHVHIDDTKLAEAVRLVCEENPERVYVRQSRPGVSPEMCFYTHFTDTPGQVVPGCVFGAAFAKLKIVIPPQFDMQIDELLSGYFPHVSFKMRRACSAAQVAQDNGGTWGHVAKVLELAMRERGLVKEWGLPSQ